MLPSPIRGESDSRAPGATSTWLLAFECVSGDHILRRRQTESAGRRFRFLIATADTKFTATFVAVFTASDVRIIKTPVRAPRANAIAERFVGTIRRELLDHLLIINQRHAAAVLRVFERHHNHHRPHHTLGQAAPSRPLRCRAPTETHEIQRHDRLGGLVHEYPQVA